MFNALKTFFTQRIAPKSQNEDRARAEFILNIFLWTGISLTAVAFFTNVLRTLLGLKNSISILPAFLQLAYFAGLYALSRKGYTRVASGLLLATFFALASFMAVTWGVDLSMVLLANVLVIVMAGILINTRTAFVSAGIVCLTLATINGLQARQILSVDRTWRTPELWGVSEVITFSLVFFIIATVSWLSNREIEKSLRRARRSEAELKVERDQLEVKVSERTQELQAAQAERVAQLYRFAEFGRISAGMFHDLMTPLSAVSMSMEYTRSIEQQEGAITSQEAKESLDKAIRVAKKLQDLVLSVRKQLTRQGNKSLFSLCEEVELVIDILSYKARSLNVEIQFSSDHQIRIFGDAVRFNQLVLNLITNALDSYPPLPESSKETSFGHRMVLVALEDRRTQIVLTVKDQGNGIPDQLLARIFEPFFTTKVDGHGIGLSMTKRIVEKDFHGTIQVESSETTGSTFIITLPHEQPTDL